MEKLFLITYEIRSGEDEHVSRHVVKAEDGDKAEKIALDYAKDFWGEDHTKPDKDRADMFWRSDGCEVITLEGVEEVTPELLIECLRIH